MAWLVGFSMISGRNQSSTGPDDKTPSFDLKLLIAFHLSMMILMVLAQTVPIDAEVKLAAVLAAVLISLSIWNRRRANWRWQPVGITRWLSALAGLILGALFLGASAVRWSPWSTPLFPWFAAGTAIILTNVLSTLGIVQQRERDFQQRCGDLPSVPIEAAPTDSHAPWRKAVQRAFSTLFMAVWLGGVAFFWTFNLAMKNGSSQPTAERATEIREHGHSVYVTASEAARIHLLEHVMTFGIPAILLLGVLLHFGFGVKVFQSKASSRY
jgi:hypothetical protein